MTGMSNRSVAIVVVGLMLAACETKLLEPHTAEEGQLTPKDAQIVSWAKEAAQKIGKVMERWVKEGAITEEQLFAEKYTYIENTDPPKFHTAYDKLTDDEVGPIQEVYLSKAKLRYFVLVDRNGYLPSHNKKFCKPLLGDKQKDLMRNRTKRKFNDPIGLAAARSPKPHVVHTYTRGDGERSKDLAVPVKVFGKHWGAIRVGYMIQ